MKMNRNSAAEATDSPTGETPALKALSMRSLRPAGSTGDSTPTTRRLGASTQKRFTAPTRPWAMALSTPAFDAVEALVHDPGEGPAALAPEPVRVQGDGVRALEQLQEQEEDQGREDEQLELLDDPGEGVETVEAGHVVGQDGVQRLGVAAQEDAQKGHEAHGHEHGLVRRLAPGAGPCPWRRTRSTGT